MNAENSIAKAVVLLSILASNGVSVSAQQSEVRSITQTEATSECIGNPKTPLCAVETFLACATRRQITFCHAVGVRNFSFDDRIVANEYTVLSETLLRQEDIPEDLKDTDWYQAGNVYIQLNKRYRLADGTLWPVEGWAHFNYYLKPAGDGWRLVSQSATGHEDFAE